MIIGVGNAKGGVGKTTDAIHLAAYLQTLAPTLLVDGDHVCVFHAKAATDSTASLPPPTRVLEPTATLT